MQLYGYWRSSAAYRVRIAMHLKGIAFESIAVHLVKDGGQQHSEDYVAMNPTHLVPTLVDGEFRLNQSLAIIDYLEAIEPLPSLLPTGNKQAAIAKALAYDIACEVHPLNNLRVQQYLSAEMTIDDSQKSKWIHHWMALGFSAFEKQISGTAGEFCVGDSPTLADICLIPQIYNAKRFGVDLSLYPTINRVVESCDRHPAFIQALPENQPDANQ